MKAWQVVGACIGVGSALAGVGAAALGWVIARKLTAPVGPRTFDLVVRSVEHDLGDLKVVLDRTPNTSAKRIYNLWFERGGWVQLGDEVEDRGPERIARRITGTSEERSPRAGDRVSWSGIYFATPEDAGLDAREVQIQTPAGDAPAWLIEGDPKIWAIHIHGLGSTRASTLRGAQVATELGYTSLIVSYRNDGEGPNAGTGRSTLGTTETEDVDAALDYAARQGAERIVLFGWSMGGAIALQLASRSRHSPQIVGLVLDSPVLDWMRVIEANCARSGLPSAAARCAIPWLKFDALARLVGLPHGIPFGQFDWLQRASELTVPMLILQGTEDDSVPASLCTTLHDQRPDLVELQFFAAGHTLSWNASSGKWRAAAGRWLQKNATV